MRIFLVLFIAAAALVIAPETHITAEEFILDQILSRDQHCWAWLSTPFAQFFAKSSSCGQRWPLEKHPPTTLLHGLPKGVSIGQ